MIFEPIPGVLCWGSGWVAVFIIDLRRFEKKVTGQNEYFSLIGV